MLFSPTLTCFYCGTRTGRKWNRSIRKFHCSSCEADNYLDENGEITEPQIESGPSTPPLSQSSTSFSGGLLSSAPPELGIDSSNIWCRTCLHNQRFLTESLASYLPSTSDPKYVEYEQNLPQYRQELEERYPQVCAACAPKANARLRTATYAASADHLRRRTLTTRRQGAAVSSSRSWLPIALLGGQLLWWTSNALQIVYNLSNLLPPDEDLAAQESRVSITACLSHTLQTRMQPHGCEEVFANLAWTGIILGLVSAWYHPAIREQTYTRNSQLNRYGDFAIFQIAVLALRLITWWISKDPEHSKLSRKLDIPLEAVHGFMLIFTIITNMVALRLVTVRSKTTFPFNRPLPEIIVPEGGSTIDDLFTPTQPQTQSFTIGSLDPLQKLRRNSMLSIAPTEPDNDDTKSTTTETTRTTCTENRMDWEPTPPNTTAMTASTTSFHPNPSTRTLRPRVVGNSDAFASPSPFRGTLPPAPEPPAHKLRKPKAPAFQAASEMSKESFFRGRGLDEPEYKPAVINRPDLAEAKFRFDGGGKQADTGLEDLFGRSFAIEDERPLVAGGQAEGSGQTAAGSDSALESLLPTMMLGLACIVGVLYLVFWGYQQIIQSDSGGIEVGF